MKRIGGFLGIVLLALVLVLVPMGTAKADNQKGFYVGLFAGYVIPNDVELESGASVDIAIDNSYSLGIKAGYIFPQVPYLAAELEYQYIFGQDFENATYFGDLVVTGDDVKVQALMANLILRYPHEMFRPYIGFGIGWSWIDGTLSGYSITEGPLSSSDISDNAWAWQFLVGINFAFAKNWSADLGYRYFAAENFTYNDPEGDIDVKYTNSTIILGINYHF
jgi:opacity protein-like surface antigen